MRETAVSFELEPPSEAEMARRIAAAQAHSAWLVLDAEIRSGEGDLTTSQHVVAPARRPIGYAYAGPFRERAAYRHCCEVSVYVARDHRGAGAGRALYDALLPRLVALGFHVAVAGMTLPNPASVALHRAMGFEPVGVFRGVGFKFGAWHDVAWMQRPLDGGEQRRSPVPAPTPAAGQPRPPAGE